MSSKIFINLPVKDLKKSVDFFTKLGYTFNPQFTDESATCMIVSENIFVMLLVRERFKEFTKKEVADATKTTEVLIALECGSKAEVDDIVRKAKEAGGTIYAEPNDHGWMYQHSFADLDGHQWEYAYMDISAFPQN